MTRRNLLFTAMALAVAVGLATGLSPLASSNPDGLNRVASDHGFAGAATEHALQGESPVPGYAFPGIGEPHLAKGLAGFIGTIGIFAIAFAIAWMLRRSRRDGGVPT